jgi:hypothetical protein
MIAPKLLQLPERGRCADARQMPASNDPQKALRGPPEWGAIHRHEPGEPESGLGHRGDEGGGPAVANLGRRHASATEAPRPGAGSDQRPVAEKCW